ncbi:hypothetical protein M501DRAFT_986739 [Patellaria atrata CBS 101060]|uniref:Clr5 domain-containing protein n=1 Tax=Patellaria atrata CBS 101060 TaxID=1346257 RepID=A0A9P4S6N5_9PEZI|nr:hypothetical protein M501DRAFT_986739 [Patellaria atrata CBS 101060]
METCHSFKASKAQYERQFKRWALRKNITSKEWKTVGHKIEKRKRNEKESEVIVDGIVIPTAKVRKETSRNTFTAMEKYSAASARTPEGINIRTPTASVHNTMYHRLPYSIYLNSLYSRYSISPDNSATLQFPAMLSNKIRVLSNLLSVRKLPRALSLNTQQDLQKVINPILPTSFPSAIGGNDTNARDQIAVFNFFGLLSNNQFDEILGEKRNLVEFAEHIYDYKNREVLKALLRNYFRVHARNWIYLLSGSSSMLIAIPMLHGISNFSQGPQHPFLLPLRE